MIPPAPMTGTSPATHWLNRLREFCISIRPLSGVGYRLQEHTFGTGFDFDRSPGGGGLGNPISWYQFVTMNLDDMDCHIWDDVAGKAGTTIIKVIKPPLLKGSLAHRLAGAVSISYSGYNSGNQSRVATNGTGPITQFITPLYASGDLIQAVTIGSKIYDINVDGRVFAGPSQ